MGQDQKDLSPLTQPTPPRQKGFVHKLTHIPFPTIDRQAHQPAPCQLMLPSEESQREGGGSVAVDLQVQQQPEGKGHEATPLPPESALSKFNNFLHSNIYVYLISYYLYWLGFWLFFPLVAFFFMLGMGLYDLFTAKGFRKPCGPVLITGCSSGFGFDLTMALGARGWKVRLGSDVWRKGGGDACLAFIEGGPNCSTYPYLPHNFIQRSMPACARRRTWRPLPSTPASRACSWT